MTVSKYKGVFSFFRTFQVNPVVLKNYEKWHLLLSEISYV